LERVGERKISDNTFLLVSLFFGKGRGEEKKK
jgi:hypothetical protein